MPQDTAYSRHTSDTDRFDEAIEHATFARSRPVNRALAGTAREVCVNVPRGHNSSAHTSRRLRHDKPTAPPEAGTSLILHTRRSLTSDENTAHSGQAASVATISITPSTPSPTPDPETLATKNSSKPNNNDVQSCTLVASSLESCQRPSACRGHEHLPRYNTPLKSEEPDTRARARFAVAEYIEVFYNRKRHHSTLGYRTPPQALADHHKTPTAA